MMAIDLQLVNEAYQTAIHFVYKGVQYTVLINTMALIDILIYELYIINY